MHCSTENTPLKHVDETKHECICSYTERQLFHRFYMALIVSRFRWCYFGTYNIESGPFSRRGTVNDEKLMTRRVEWGTHIFGSFSVHRRRTEQSRGSKSLVFIEKFTSLLIPFYNLTQPTKILLGENAIFPQILWKHYDCII